MIPTSVLVGTGIGMVICSFIGTDLNPEATIGNALLALALGKWVDGMWSAR